jgi:hypothetical protein
MEMISAFMREPGRENGGVDLHSALAGEFFTEDFAEDAVRPPTSKLAG